MSTLRISGSALNKHTQQLLVWLHLLLRNIAKSSCAVTVLNEKKHQCHLLLFANVWQSFRRRIKPYSMSASAILLVTLNVTNDCLKIIIVSHAQELRCASMDQGIYRYRKGAVHWGTGATTRRRRSKGHFFDFLQVRCSSRILLVQSWSLLQKETIKSVNYIIDINQGVIPLL